jgi:hypothetical protein
MHIASVDQKQYEPLSAALRLSSTLLSSFHFSVYSPTASRQPCRLSPVACIPFQLIFSSCQAATLPSYDSRAEITERGNWETGGAVTVAAMSVSFRWGLQGGCKKC